MTKPLAVTATDRRLWALAWPLMLTNLTLPLLGLVDTAVLGHLDRPEYLGAVAVGANLFTLLYWTFGFMRMGTTGLAAQAFGRRDHFGQTALLVRSLALAVAIGLVLIAVHQPLIRLGLVLMNPGPEIKALAAEYAAIRIWSAPAVLCQYTLVGWLIGTQCPRGPMLMLIVANGLNIVLDIVFVTVLGWNSRGVAMATVMAEYAATTLGFWLVLKRLPAGQRFSRALLGRLADYTAILRVNRYLLVRTVTLLLVLAFFTAQGARQGEVTLAANAVLITFLLVISNGLDGFANAAEALVGEAVGRGSRRQFRVVCRAALRWSLWGRCCLPWPLCWGAPTDQSADQHRRGSAARLAVSALALAAALDDRLGLPARRHLHWCDPHPGHAEHHAAGRLRGVPSGVVAHHRLG